jgi:PAS domain S-box-containing protein
VTKTIQPEAEERFRLLVESVKDYAIFILDPTGHVATWNLGAERIKGYTATEIIGKHFSTFYPPEDVADGKCERELEIATREGRFEEEGWRIRKDGSRMWASVTITALFSPEGGLVGFAKVTRDLTERLQTEQRLRELAAETAALAEKSRIHEFQERFLAILGHDLRNPLASIDMGTGLLRKRATDPSTIRVLERMRASSARMSRMIAQILDLTRTRLGGGIELHPDLMDLQKTISRVVEELRNANPAAQVVVRCSSISGTWDRDRLEQLFSNLVGNALTHGDPAHPVTVDGQIEGDRVVVSVHNEGPPISEEVQASIFDPFRRGQRDGRTAKTGGLGLGLYISNEIARAHGGRIELESEAGAGTTFRVTLPRRTPDAGR